VTAAQLSVMVTSASRQMSLLRCRLVVCAQDFVNTLKEMPPVLSCVSL
jgi:hypothetical protein